MSQTQRIASWYQLENGAYRYVDLDGMAWDWGEWVLAIPDGETPTTCEIAVHEVPTILLRRAAGHEREEHQSRKLCRTELTDEQRLACARSFGNSTTRLADWLGYDREEVEDFLGCSVAQFHALVNRRSQPPVAPTQDLEPALQATLAEMLGVVENLDNVEAVKIVEEHSGKKLDCWARIADADTLSPEAELRACGLTRSWAPLADWCRRIFLEDWDELLQSVLEEMEAWPRPIWSEDAWFILLQDRSHSRKVAARIRDRARETVAALRGESGGVVRLPQLLALLEVPISQGGSRLRVLEGRGKGTYYSAEVLEIGQIEKMAKLVADGTGDLVDSILRYWRRQ